MRRRRSSRRKIIKERVALANLTLRVGRDGLRIYRSLDLVTTTPLPTACCVPGLVGHAFSPPIAPSYHRSSAQLLQAPVTRCPAGKTPQTALGLCTLATPGFPKGIQINISLKRDLFCWITWNSLALNLSVIHHIQWNHVKVGALTICPVYERRNIPLAKKPDF